MTQPVFDRAIEEHAGLIDRIVATFERNPASREDVKQEIALALWRAASSWRGDCTLRTFVARIAHNVCVSHVRKAIRLPKGGAPSLDLASDIEPSDEAAIRADLTRRLNLAVDALPLGLRETATFYLEGFSTKEIAETLGVNEGAVSTRINRVKAALRAQMVDR